MSSDKLFSQPVSPSREMLELLEEWVAPDVTDDLKKKYEGKTNFMGVSIEEIFNKSKQDEIEVEEEEVKPLTAEEIEEIRQQAYEEGFQQGKEEGFDKGHEEGLEQGYKDGLEQGHAEGHELGLTEGQEIINQQVAHWQSLCNELVEPIKKVDAIAEQQLVNLAIMLAESVLRVETQTNKDALLTVLHESISSLPFNTEYAELLLHPEDIKIIEAAFEPETITENNWIFKEQPSYQRGSLTVMTPNSLIDRTVKQRIKQVFDTFIQRAELDKELSEGQNIASGEDSHSQSEMSEQTAESAEQTSSESQPADLDLGQE